MKRSKPNLYIRILNLVSLVIIAGSFITVFIMWNSIPSQVPIHFNVAGQVDKYGDKNGIWILLGMGLFLYILISIFQLIVKHSYAKFKTKEENREIVYQITLSMFVTIKFFMVTVLPIVAVFMMFSKSPPFWLFELLPLLNIGAVIFCLVLMYVKTKNKQ